MLALPAIDVTLNNVTDTLKNINETLAHIFYQSSNKSITVSQINYLKQLDFSEDPINNLLFFFSNNQINSKNKTSINLNELYINCYIFKYLVNYKNKLLNILFNPKIVI